MGHDDEKVLEKGASIEATLELWVSSQREVKARMRPLFSQAHVAASANSFLDGLLGDERRRAGWRGHRRTSLRAYAKGGWLIPLSAAA